MGCDICLTEEATNRAELPDGWLITLETTTTFCSSCLNRWAEKYNEEPEYLMKGGEREPELPFYNLEELHNE